MELGIAIQEFFVGYFSTNPRSNKTRRAYVSDLRQFVGFTGSGVDITSLKSKNIEDWASELRKRPYSDASIRRKLAVLKVFCSYWVRSGLISESPFLRLQIRFERKLQLPRTLSEREVKSFLRIAAIESQSAGSTNTSKCHLRRRNCALLEILFATGMRVGEVSAINLDDFLPEEGAIRVHGKGGRERLAYIVDSVAIVALEAYLSVRKTIPTTTNALFVNSRGFRLSTQGIANVVLKIASTGGDGRRVTPHMFRHTIATLLLRNGVDMRVVQEFLGHASITTTQRYTHVSKEHLRRALFSSHPSLAFQR